MSQDNKIIRVGSRKSELALIQTRYVISCLEKLYPDKQFEIHTMTTVGDRVLNISLPKIGEKSLFTKDLEDALRTGGVDLVVHSLKDLPTALPAGMAIGAILEREDPRDALVLNAKHKGCTLDTLPAGCVIGTSSLRRTAQIARSFPHLKVCDVRGNLNTRLSKLDCPDSVMGGLLLAKAGLVRMGWENRVDQTLDCAVSLYAVGQGALAVECRSQDDYITKLIEPLTHKDTLCRVLAERSFLKTLGGGCSAPVAVSSKLKLKPGEKNVYDIKITGAVWSLDGKILFKHSLQRELEDSKLIDDVETPVAKRTRTENQNENVNDNNIDNNGTSVQFINTNSTNCLCKNLKNEKNIDCLSKGLNNLGCPYSKNNGSENIFEAQPSGSQNESNMESMLLAHNNVLKQCPQSDCPIDLPVGTDFMGECPFLNTKSSEITKCPFSKNDNKEVCPLRLSNDVISTSNLDVGKCPFLNKDQVKTIEYTKSDKEISIIDEKVSDENVLCGILHHRSICEDLFKNCEKIGKDLAEILIENGALEVMKAAQHQIRTGK